MPMNRRAENSSEEEAGYDTYTKDDLKQVAAEWEIEGRSSMSKEELIAAIEAAEAGGGEGAVAPAHEGES